MAGFVCLAAARSKVLRQASWDADAQGLFGAPAINVCFSTNAHAAIFAALRYLGLGHDRVKGIPTDDVGRMDAAALSSALASCDRTSIAIVQAGLFNTGKRVHSTHSMKLQTSCIVTVDGFTLTVRLARGRGRAPP